MNGHILKTVLIGASILLIFAGGLAVGWWFKEKAPPDTVRPESDAPGQHAPAPVKIKYQVRDKELLGELPEWGEWQYPASKKHSSSTGGGYTLGSTLEFAQPQCVVLTSSDDLAKVWAYYQDKCKLEGDTVTTGNLGGSLVGANASGVTHITLADHRFALTFEAPPGPRVKARGFTVGTARYDLTVLLQPMEGESRTCIFLVYRPNKAFQSLLKQVVSD
jgi:hypothetical protein